MPKKKKIKAEPVEEPEDVPVGPEIVQIIDIPLEDVDGLFGNLPEEQQKRQSSEVFEAFGMHWLLTLEADRPVKGSNPRDIYVMLWCLSCNIPSP